MKKVIAMVMTVVMMLGLGTTAFADNAPLTADQAMQAAMDFAGVNASEASFTRAHRGYDDGREVYEIEFYANNTEYDMDVDVFTGRITDFSTEYHGMQATRGYGFQDDDMFDRDQDWDDMYDRDHDWDDMFDRDHDWDDMYDRDHDWDDPWDFD